MPSPPQPPDPGHMSADDFAKRGNTHLKQDRYEEAIADCTEAIRLDPKQWSAYFDRGVAHIARGEFDQAIADFSEVIRLGAVPAYAHFNLGVAHSAKAEYDEAIADFDAALRLNPGDAITHLNRGVAYRGKDDHDRAIADFTEAIRLDPGSARAYEERAAAHRRKGDWDEGLADCTEALRLDPERVSAYITRARLHAAKAKDHYHQAIADLTEAIRLDPTNRTAYDERVSAYRALGLDRRAARDIRRLDDLRRMALREPPDGAASPAGACTDPAALPIHPLHFVLGYLDEYGGRMIQENDDLVDRLNDLEAEEADVFKTYLLKLAEEKGIQTTLRTDPRGPQDGMVLRSRELAEVINRCYDVALDHSSYLGVPMGYVSEAMLGEGDPQARLSFLAGAYARYGEGDGFRFINAGHKVKLVAQLLEEFGCGNVSYHEAHPGYIPATFVITFEPSATVEAWLAPFRWRPARG